MSAACKVIGSSWRSVWSVPVSRWKKHNHAFWAPHAVTEQVLCRVMCVCLESRLQCPNKRRSREWASWCAACVTATAAGRRGCFHRETRPQVLFLVSGESTDFLIVLSLSHGAWPLFIYFFVCVRFHVNIQKVPSFTVKSRTIFGTGVMQFVPIWFNLLFYKEILLKLKI